MLISSSSSASDNICLNFSLAVLLDNGDCSSKSSSRNKLIASVLDPVLSSSSDSLVVLSLLLSEPLLSESSSSDLLLSEPSLSEHHLQNHCYPNLYLQNLHFLNYQVFGFLEVVLPHVYVLMKLI